MAKALRIIGLTGGVATGKTEALKLFRRRRFSVLSADVLSHACLRRGHPVYRAILKRWGKTVLRDNGEIDRSKLAAIVFANPQERHCLEGWIHPWVKKAMRSFIHKQRGPVVLEIPLLFEAGWAPWMDAIVVVTSSRAQQMARLQRSRGLSRRQAVARLKAQWPMSRKIQNADYVLRNTTTRQALQQQIKKLAMVFRKRSA